ncbi:MAG: arylsulfatase [Sediminibacterium sp.]|jgi:arylsulfatase A-like enzyme
MKKILITISLYIIVFFCAAQKNDNTKPNIILILADDISYNDISFFGQDKFKTPNIDRIANEGIVFTRSYSAQGECAPSRCGLLTGKHMGHATIRANESVRGEEYLKKSDYTIAKMLKASNYVTGFIGKWGVGLPGSEGEPNKQGFDYSFGFYSQLQAHTYYPTYLYENSKKFDIPENKGYDIKKMYEYNSRPINKLAEFKNRYDADGNYVAEGIANPKKAVNSENLFIEKALNFIQTNKSKPFFLYYATQLPHGPIVTDNLGEFKDRKDYPSLKHKEYASMITRLDNNVGRMIDLLKKLNIEENTIIVFAGDNGYSAWGYFGRKRWDDDEFFKNKGPYFGGKFSLYEGGVRVPTFIKWNNKIKPGSKSDLQIASYDFLATFANIAGNTKKIKTDGISFLQELTGDIDRQTKHKFLYWEYTDYQVAIIDHWRVERAHPDSACKLYDNYLDAYSKTNIAEKHLDIIEQAKKIFKNEHVKSKWYSNPGETVEERKKLKKYVIKNNLINNAVTLF